MADSLDWGSGVMPLEATKLLSLERLFLGSFVSIFGRRPSGGERPSPQIFHWCIPKIAMSYRLTQAVLCLLSMFRSVQSEEYADDYGDEEDSD